MVAVEVRAAAGEAFGLKGWRFLSVVRVCEIESTCFWLPFRLVHGVARPRSKRLSPIHRDQCRFHFSHFFIPFLPRIFLRALLLILATVSDLCLS